MAELDDLKEIRELAFARLRNTNSDHAFSEVAGKLLATVKRIGEISPESSSVAPQEEESTLSEFEKKLAERQPKATDTRRRASR